MTQVLKPLARVLRVGLPASRPVRHDDRQILELQGLDGRPTLELPYEDLSASDWGYVYERVVGCSFEANGYIVEQRGIELQLLDDGIDIVAELPGEKDVFIQCKSGSKRIGKQAVERLLYSGGNFIHRHRKYKTSELILAAPDINAICTPFNRQRFLSHNQNSFGVRLSVVEVPWAVTATSEPAGI